MLILLPGVLHPDALDALLAHEDVEYIEEDGRMSASVLTTQYVHTHMLPRTQLTVPKSLVDREHLGACRGSARTLRSLLTPRRLT